MKLSEISVPKLDGKIAEIQKKIDELRQLEKQAEELQKIKDVVMWENDLGRKSKTPLFTQQSKRTLEFMRRFFYLCLYKGVDGISRFVSAYASDVDLLQRGKEGEEALYKSWKAQMDKILEDFKLKD